jgi:hypothetical protein
MALTAFKMTAMSVPISTGVEGISHLLTKWQERRRDAAEKELGSAAFKDHHWAQLTLPQVTQCKLI